MTRMGLVAFLLGDCIDSVSRTMRLAKYAADPGGQDYHWAAKLAAARMFGEDLSFDQAVSEVMASIKRDHQRRDNQDALKTLYDWKISRPGVFRQPPAGELTGPCGELTITLKPVFALERKGVTTAYVPWMFKDVRLTAQVAGIGVHLLELGLQKDEYAGWRFALIDTVSGKCFNRTHKHTAEAANFAVRTTEEMLIAARVRRAA
ncbi:hypothetical protein [Brevundimonas bullata]|jgi:hypothetical protein